MVTAVSNAAVSSAGDFSWIHGANYVPSYAATGIELWLNYDHATIDRELGFAESIGLNCVRVFLHSLVYHHDPQLFRDRFEDFVATAHARGLKVMPVLFDSCFGVAPSMESQHMWVANPGPDRMTEEFWSESDRYLRDVVSRYVGDDRIALWDVMNEPTATYLAKTPEGQARIDRFLRHYCPLVREIDPTHAITVGVATWDNTGVIDLVDVLTCHSYSPGFELFRKTLEGTHNQARAAGKPWIVSECGNVAAGNSYEMVMQVVREFRVGHLLWELMIGRLQFNRMQGLFYPDGTVRRIAQVEAIMDAPAQFLTEKPDSEGIPFNSSMEDRVAEYVHFLARNAITEDTWRERNTAVYALIERTTYGDSNDDAEHRLETARRDYAAGRKKEACAAVRELLREADKVLSSRKDVGYAPPAPERATIHRDVYGVPHIYADTEASGAYALAFCQCEDDAQQVFENLPRGIGRAAEVLGESALDSDLDVRRWRIPEIAEDTWRKSSLRTKRMLQAFCDGLNAYRKQHPEEWGDALEATPVQVLAWAKYCVLMPSIQAVKIDVTCTITGADRPPEDAQGSSAWVIGPSRTASGKPILLIDPHWPPDGPLSWFEFHLHAGRSQIGGFAVPGLPYALTGYTSGAAWSGSAGGADSADAYELRINPQNPNQYWFDGAWQTMEVRELQVSIKTENGIEQRRFVSRETVHGPVVHEHNGRIFAGAICGWKDTLYFEQFLEMNRTKTKQQLLDAMRMDQVTWTNFCYATREGHFGYVQLGCCPVRSERPGPYRALDGARSSAMWTGVIPFDKLPQVHDPETGWVQSCNTSADKTTAGLNMTPDDFPPGVLFGHYGSLRWRGERCSEVLSKMEKATVEDAKALAFDTFAPMTVLWVPALVAAYDSLAEKTPDPSLDLKIAVDAVRAWDGHVTKDSCGATVFRFWREEYGKMHPEAFGDNERNGFPRTDAEKADAVEALKSATQRMKKLYGSVLVPWGQILRLRRGEISLPLDGDSGGPFPTECLRCTGGLGKISDDGREYAFNHGQVVPGIVHLTDPIEVWSVVPYGQSRKPGAIHSVDQMKLYSEGRMRPAWHDWASLRDRIESSRTVEYVPPELRRW